MGLLNKILIGAEKAKEFAKQTARECAAEAEKAKLQVKENYAEHRKYGRGLCVPDTTVTSKSIVESSQVYGRYTGKIDEVI